MVITRVHDLSEVELFEGLNDVRLDSLQDMSKLREFARGDILYLPGDNDKYVYIVASGLVKIAKINDSGKELTLAIYGAGDIFGELALMVDRPRRTQATAAIKSSIWCLPLEPFKELVSSSPNLSMQLSTIIGERRHDLENRMENLVFRDVPARLASLLISLADQYGMMRQGKIHIEMKLSQLELANFIGATRETTSTVINDLKRRGILDTHHRTIIINDIERLGEIREAL